MHEVVDGRPADINGDVLGVRWHEGFFLAAKSVVKNKFGVAHGAVGLRQSADNMKAVVFRRRAVYSFR